MESLKISFEVKRPRKIYKVMDYVYLLGVICIAAIIIVFLPFVNKEGEKANSMDKVNVAQARLTLLEKSAQESYINNAEDKEYQKNYDIIDDAIVEVHNYIQSLNDFKDVYFDGRFEYASQTVNDNVILISLTDTGASNNLIEFKRALLDNPKYTYTVTDASGTKQVTIDLSWISKIELNTSMSSNNISMEVYYGE